MLHPQFPYTDVTEHCSLLRRLAGAAAVAGLIAFSPSAWAAPAPAQSSAAIVSNNDTTDPAASKLSPQSSASAAAPLREYQQRYLAWAQDKASRLGLARNRTWLRLGHYRRRTFGGFKSEVDGARFFLAPNGVTDPAAEMQATLQAMLGTDPAPAGQDHPICRFPARARFLTQALELDPARIPPRSCLTLDLHWDRLKAEGVTLIFSSYYLNNPASGFGHTFLRINRRPDPGEQKRPDLLHSGVDFSADVDTGNAIAYAVKGLFGMFPGTFKLLPYFYKVREYNDYESRDLWEYDLNFSQDQVWMLSAHLWELGHTHFDYWYLDENCSYHILALVEVARPDLELLKYVDGAQVVPADTIKSLWRNPGLVRGVRYRPSTRAQFRRQLEGLDSREQQMVAALAENPDAEFPKEFTDLQKARVLDAALEHTDFRFARDLVHEENNTSPGALHKQRIEERRADLLVQTETLTIPTPNDRRPEFGHGSTRVGLGTGASTQGRGFYELTYRLNLHDLVDSPRGYPEMAAIEFLPTRIRFWPHEQQIRLEDISAVQVTSLSPQDRFDRRMTWHVRVGGTRVRDDGCANCFGAVAEVGGGAAFSWWRDALTIFGTLDTHVFSGPRLDGGIADIPVRAGVGPWGGTRIRWSQDLVTLVQGRVLALPFQTPKWTWQAETSTRWLIGRAAAVGVEGRMWPAAREAQFSTYFYY